MAGGVAGADPVDAGFEALLAEVSCGVASEGEREAVEEEVVPGAVVASPVISPGAPRPSPAWVMRPKSRSR